MGRSLLACSVVCLLSLVDRVKGSNTYFMQGASCDGNVKPVVGAVVYSHVAANQPTGSYYQDNVNCQLTFRAEKLDWKLMINIVALDIPDRTSNDICNDAIYMYDGSGIYSMPVKQAGGTGGLCGRTIPPIIYSAGPFLTIYFRTNDGGPRGTGFVLIITAYHNAENDRLQQCGASSYLCVNNNKCIDQKLVCDGVNNCGGRPLSENDNSKTFLAQDELTVTKGGICRSHFDLVGSPISRLLPPGIAASLTVGIGTVSLSIACLFTVICCCRQCCRRLRQRNENNGALRHKRMHVTAETKQSLSKLSHDATVSIDSDACYQPQHSLLLNTRAVYQHSPITCDVQQPAVDSSRMHTTDHVPHNGALTWLQSPPIHQSRFTPPASTRSGQSARLSNDDIAKYNRGRLRAAVELSLSDRSNDC